jgi:23S rRNA (guanine745-N1)-methyltransferase
MISIYMCPVCHVSLDSLERQFACANGHTFDIAREGYVNLLLAHHKKTADPGDNKEMIKSRRAFLENGHYDTLSEELNKTVIATFCDTTAEDRVQILDAGCGEGFYLWQLSNNLKSQGLSDAFGLWGLDISRSAIRYAARRDEFSKFAVGSTYRLPILPKCLNAILCIFAPGSSEEFQRILKPCGKLITLSPGPKHLAALKAMIYDAPEDHQVETAVPAGFAHSNKTHISHRLHLENSEDIGNLLLMTPYYWHMDKPTQERVLSMAELETEIDIILTTYQKIDN